MKTKTVNIRSSMSLLRIQGGTVIALILCYLLTNLAYAQYPKRLNFGTVNAGGNVMFTIVGSINKPSMGMQTITYRFTNNTAKEVDLKWTTTISLTGGSTKTNQHSYRFEPHETEDFGWGEEGDIIDIKQDGGEAVSVVIKLMANTSEREALQNQQEIQQIRNQNRNLKQQIETEITDFPTRDQKRALQEEYQAITVKHQETDPQLTLLLENLLKKVQDGTHAVKNNLREFETKHIARQDQIDNMRDEGGDITRQQEEIADGMVATGAMLLGFNDVNGSQFRYRGPSYKMGFKLGLHASMQPYAFTEYRNGSMINNDNGQIIPINESELREDNMLVPGFYGAVELSPYFSNFFSFSFIGDAYFDYWPNTYEPVSNDDGNDYISNAYNAVWAYSYGLESTYGNQVKLLLRLKWEQKNISSSSVASYTLAYSGYSSEAETWHSEDQNWRSTEAVMGMRFGNYETSRYFFDFGFVKTTTTLAGGLRTPFKFKNLFTFQKSDPWGIYMQYSGQSGWTMKGLFMKNIHLIDVVGKTIYTAEKSFYQISISRGLDFFGRPYRK